jgi:hypothetical protein
VSTNQTAATYPDSTGLVAGTVYYYVVSASNAGGTCASNNSSPAVSAMSCTLPANPIGLTATRGIGQVVLTWTASTGAASYEVRRGTASGGPYNTSVATPVLATSTDTTVTNDTTYYYVVIARNGLNNACVSAQSSQASATPRSCQTVLDGSVLGRTLNSTADCFVTCDVIAAGNWQCSNFGTADRAIKVNGTSLASCGAALPASRNGAYTFNIAVAPTGHTWDYIYWWNATINNCAP